MKIAGLTRCDHQFDSDPGDCHVERDGEHDMAMVDPTKTIGNSKFWGAASHCRRCGIRVIYMVDMDALWRSATKPIQPNFAGVISI